MSAPPTSPLIVDAHQDIAWMEATYGWDFRTPVAEKRRSVPQGARVQQPMLSLDGCLAGRLAVVFATLFAEPRRRTEQVGPDTYSTPLEAEALARRQLDYYRRLADEEERIDLIGTVDDVERVLETWDKEDPHLGLVPLMEGADPIVFPAQAGQWMGEGVRIIGLAWSGGRYAGGTWEPGGLTAEGRMLLREMASLGLILDCSHLAEAAFFEALLRFEGSAIASHSNCRALVPGDRQLSDEMIEALVERGGVVGVVLHNGMLRRDWSAADGKEAVGLPEIAAHIDHVCQLAGSADHVGLGSDFDGGFGSEKAPREMDTVADLWLVGPELEARGFGSEDVAKVLGGNWLRVLGEGLPV